MSWQRGRIVLVFNRHNVILLANFLQDGDQKWELRKHWLPDNLLNAVKFAEKKERLDEPTTLRFYKMAHFSPLVSILNIEILINFKKVLKFYNTILTSLLLLIAPSFRTTLRVLVTTRGYAPLT